MEKLKKITAEINAKIAESMFAIIDEAIAERRRHHSKHSKLILKTWGLGAIARSYAAVNAAYSVAANVIPGPAGMMAMVPEVLAVTRNHVRMLYDIGVMAGRKDQLSRELFIAILLDEHGRPDAQLITRYESELFVKRASMAAARGLAERLSAAITGRYLRTAALRWIPLAGITAIAWWTWNNTVLLAGRGLEFMKLELKEHDQEYHPPESGKPEAK